MQFALLGLVALISAPPAYQLQGSVLARVSAGVGSSPRVANTATGQIFVYQNSWVDETVEPSLTALMYARRWRLSLRYTPNFTRRDYFQDRGLTVTEQANSGKLRTMHTGVLEGTALFPRNWEARLRGQVDTGETTGTEAADTLGTTTGSQTLGVGFYRFLSLRGELGVGGDLGRRWLTYASVSYAHTEPLSDSQTSLLAELRENDTLTAAWRLGYRLTRVDTLGARLMYTRAYYQDRYTADTGEGDLVYQRSLSRLSSLTFGGGVAVVDWRVDDVANTPESGLREDTSIEPRLYLTYQGPLITRRGSQLGLLARAGLVGYSDLTNYVFVTRAFAELIFAWILPPDWRVDLRLAAATPLEDPERWSLAETQLLTRPVRIPESVLRADLTVTYALNDYFDLLFGGNAYYLFTRFDRWTVAEYQYDDVTLTAFVGLRFNIETRPPSANSGRVNAEPGPGTGADIAAPLNGIGQGF